MREENPIRIADIRKCVGLYYRLSDAELRGSSRQRKYAWPRQTAMALSREMTVHSLPVIAHQFGRADHTTALHAVRAVKRREARDADFAGQIGTMRNVLTRLAWQRRAEEAERHLAAMAPVDLEPGPSSESGSGA